MLEIDNITWKCFECGFWNIGHWLECTGCSTLRSYFGKVGV